MRQGESVRRELPVSAVGKHTGMIADGRLNSPFAQADWVSKTPSNLDIFPALRKDRVHSATARARGTWRRFEAWGVMTASPGPSATFSNTQTAEIARPAISVATLVGTYRTSL